MKDLKPIIMHGDQEFAENHRNDNPVEFLKALAKDYDDWIAGFEADKYDIGYSAALTHAVAMMKRWQMLQSAKDGAS